MKKVIQKTVSSRQTLYAVLLTLRWLSYLRGIDSRDYRRRRVSLHSFNCLALRLENGRPGTCEPHPSPPGQVDRSYPVPVHYYSTFTTPELTDQSFVRLESLPASRTSYTRTSGLTPRQTDNRKAYPSGLVLYLSLGLTETPAVHSATILSTLTVTLPVEAAYTLNVLQKLSPLSVGLPLQRSSLSQCGADVQP